MNELIDIDGLLEEVNPLLDQQHDVATLGMTDLKAWAGVERLGSKIRKQIEDTLDRANIGTYPLPLPTSETQFVRLYRKSKPVGKLIAAIVEIDGDENELGKQDELIRHFITVNTSIERDALDKIRRILDALK